MHSFKSLFFALTLVAKALSAPFDFTNERDNVNGKGIPETRQVPVNGNGTHDGYFYYWWSDGVGYAQFNMGNGGQYSVDWENVSNFVGGKGWETGTGRAITYDGTFSPEGNGYLAIYGRTHDPQVEYYVIESFGTYDPGTNPNAKYRGSVDTDDGTYDIYEETRYSFPQPSVLHMYWSVRTVNRVGGTVTMQNHFNAWTGYGMELGSPDFQIVATEGYASNGSSEVIVEAS